MVFPGEGCSAKPCKFCPFRLERPASITYISWCSVTHLPYQFREGVWRKPTLSDFKIIATDDKGKNYKYYINAQSQGHAIKEVRWYLFSIRKKLAHAYAVEL